jgi:hypothetical protein
LKFQSDDGRERRLLAGLIPVGRREGYMTAPAQSSNGNGTAAASGTTAITARKTLFRTLVSEPWKALLDRAVYSIRASTETVNGNAMPLTSDALSRQRDDIQTSSWLILADLRKFLATYVPNVWARVEATTTYPAPISSPGTLTGSERMLYDSLLNTRIGSALTDPLTAGVYNASRATVASCLADALKRLTDPVVAAMEATPDPFVRASASPGWPTFLFPLVETEDPPGSAAPVFSNNPKPALTLNPPLAPDEQSDPVPPGASDPLTASAVAFKTTIDSFAAAAIRALPPNDPTPAPAPSAAAKKPADPRDGWFVLRCIYERPTCGPLHDDVVSARSVPFQLAGFFDPDAPARPIRIGLPLDTTPAGLRKFDKNTAFAISDILCGQIQRVKGLTLGDLIRSVLPWPLHKDLSVPDDGSCKTSGGLNIGTICSLSIPIITICAFILLLIIVTLLDIIFRWLPYFIICFPVPGLKGKQS